MWQCFLRPNHDASLRAPRFKAPRPQVPDLTAIDEPCRHGLVRPRAEGWMAAAERSVEESPDSQKKRCRVTPGRGDPMDSATEMKPLRRAAARVKRWGKSPPRRWQQGRHGKPHREQCQIGTACRKAGLLLLQQVRVGSYSVAGDGHVRGMVIDGTGTNLALNRIRLIGLPRKFPDGVGNSRKFRCGKFAFSTAVYRCVPRDSGGFCC